jgi:hypothetical protein
VKYNTPTAKGRSLLVDFRIKVKTTGISTKREGFTDIATNGSCG